MVTIKFSGPRGITTDDFRFVFDVIVPERSAIHSVGQYTVNSIHGTYDFNEGIRFSAAGHIVFNVTKHVEDINFNESLFSNYTMSMRNGSKITVTFDDPVSIVELRATYIASSDGQIIKGTSFSDTIHVGGDDDLSIFGGGGDDFIQAGSGATRILGGDGNDILRGGTNNTILDGGHGRDVMIGGIGRDIYFVRDLGDRVVDLGDSFWSSSDLVKAWVSFSLPDFNVTELRLMGFANVDATGNSGADLIIGNSGNNEIDGRGGIDRLKGGSGRDSFVISDRPAPIRSADTIADFSPPDDRFILPHDLFRELPLGRLPSTLFATLESPEAEHAFIIYGGDYLYFDPKGHGRGYELAHVDHHPALTAADIFVI